MGNNAQLAAALGLPKPEPFFEEKGRLIGLRSNMPIFPNELAHKLEESLGGNVKLFPCGPPTTTTIGLITGGAGSEIYAVAHEGIDTFITGEAPHWAAVAAEELGMNLLLGGHYATETFGVKALATHLSERLVFPGNFSMPRPVFSRSGLPHPLMDNLFPLLRLLALAVLLVPFALWLRTHGRSRVSRRRYKN